MEASSQPRLEIRGFYPDRIQSLRESLREIYGIYAVKMVQLDTQTEDMEVHYDNETIIYDDSRPWELSSFITKAMISDVDKLSCREDAAMLERYINLDGTLNIYEDPRDWIRANPMIDRLISAQPSINNVLDFLCEQRGLFIKPPQYKLQGTYWNSTSNGGLPVVRKRDAIHEGTFMLHDLFHMVVQDPLPYADNMEPGSPLARRNFVSHRMASEAMTMVLADMHGVHVANLDGGGYDTSKRRIYPVYKDILSSRGNIDVYDVVSANIDFCFTGEVDSLTALGASEYTINSFTEKYDTFFSADYDWNDHNYVKCNTALQDNPVMVEYYEKAREIFKLPMINDVYNGEATKDTIISSFVEQLTEAQNYHAHGNETMRMKEIARRFYGGQMALFYNGKIPDLHGSGRHTEYIALSNRLMRAKEPDEIRSISTALNEVLESIIVSAHDGGQIDSQTAALYRMHVPLYPAFFINYQQEREKIIPLQRKIALIDEQLS